FLADLREGIHLRALGRMSPLDEFHREAVTAYRGLLERIESESLATFESATITAEGLDHESAGLKRPTATWTYMVQDNPFGTEWERALRSLARKARGGR